MKRNDAAYVRARITRRPPPELDTFNCAICGRTVNEGPWVYHQQPKPLCGYCESHWSSGCRVKPTGINRADMRRLMVISALREAINWEIHNGTR